MGCSIRVAQYYVCVRLRLWLLCYATMLDHWHLAARVIIKSVLGTSCLHKPGSNAKTVNNSVLYLHKCWFLCAFFRVIPRRLNFIGRRFGTLCYILIPAYEDGTECSETSAYKIQTPGNYPEESIQHSEHGESLKSRKCWFGSVIAVTERAQVHGQYLKGVARRNYG